MTVLSPAKTESSETSRKIRVMIVDEHNADTAADGGSGRRIDYQVHWTLLTLLITTNRYDGSGDQMSPTSWNFASTISLSNGFMMYSLAPA